MSSNPLDKAAESAKQFIDQTAQADENPSRHERAGSKLTSSIKSSADPSAFDAKGSVDKHFTVFYLSLPFLAAVASLFFISSVLDLPRGLPGI